MERKKKRSSTRATLEIFILALIGAVCGFFAVQYLDLSFLSELPPRIRFLGYVLFFALIWLAYMLEIILHEMGHLVCGLLSGYRFSSFRIGRRVLLSQDGKWTWKRFSLAGTGGQCLMVPPAPKKERYPVVLYNLGGTVFNLLFGLLFLALTFLTLDVSFWLTVFFGANAFFGILYALLNGIPLRLSMVPNDGANVVALKKDPLAAKAFCIQLQISALGYEGKRIKDMPAEWFDDPDTEMLKNRMLADRAVLICNRLMDEHRFAEAEEKMKALLASDANVIGIHRKLLICDLVYCELIGACRDEVLVDYLTPEQFSFMKSMKEFPTVIRTEYAYALLREREAARVRHLRECFERVARSYPSQGDIQSERELIEYADALAKERTCTDGE